MTDETQAVPDQPDNSAPAVETPVEDTGKNHPAWNDLLNELPEAWHAKVTPYLQNADRNFQQQLEKYTPFKEYADQGVTPEVIAGGLNLARAIESDPQAVFESLRGYLIENGMMPAEAAAQAEQIMEDAGDEDSQVSSEVQKQLDELKSFKTQQEERQREAEIEKATQENIAQLESEMKTLRDAYQISEAHEIAIYDIMNAAINAGRDISLTDAAKQLQAMVGNFQPLNGKPAEQAPLVVGSGGGAGVPSPNISVPKDDKEKKVMLAQMFEQYNAANR